MLPRLVLHYHLPSHVWRVLAFKSNAFAVGNTTARVRAVTQPGGVDVAGKRNEIWWRNFEEWPRVFALVDYEISITRVPGLIRLSRPGLDYRFDCYVECAVGIRFYLH